MAEFEGKQQEVEVWEDNGQKVVDTDREVVQWFTESDEIIDDILSFVVVWGEAGLPILEGVVYKGDGEIEYGNEL